MDLLRLSTDAQPRHLLVQTLDPTFAEIPRQERFADRPDLQKIYTEAIMDDRQIRNKMVAKAFRDYGYSLSEIGRHLDLHYSAISKIVKRQAGEKS